VTWLLILSRVTGNAFDDVFRFIVGDDIGDLICGADARTALFDTYDILPRLVNLFSGETP